MAKTGKQNSEGIGAGDQEALMGPNKRKAFNIMTAGIKTATQLFDAVDATSAAMFNQEVRAKDANAFFGGQRLKLSTVQQLYRMNNQLKSVANAPIFDFSQTGALLEQPAGSRKSKAGDKS